MLPHRAAIAWPLAMALAGVVVATTAARADCFDWSAPGVVSEEGALRGFPPGLLRWRVGRVAAGGAHLRTSVELRWTAADGQERRQELFGEMQDGRAYLMSRRGRLELRVTYCPQDRACHEVALPYAWDRAAGRFEGVSPAARDSLAAACAPETGPGAAAPSGERPAR